MMRGRTQLPCSASFRVGFQRARRTGRLTGPSNRAPLSKPRKNRIREERIQNEVIVDAYGPEEQALGWYYYLENKISFPFSARCIASKIVSPLRKGETVEVFRMAPEDACAGDTLVLIRWQGRNVAVPLSQLAALNADESTLEAIADWHYWKAQGYCF
jgi:Calcium binding